MNEQLKKKVDQAIRLLQTSCKGKEVELCYSGGKDSDVILELAKMAGINYRAIYKSTTIDPEGTIAHVKSKGVEIRRPKMSFLEIVKKKGMPTMRARFCCEILKEVYADAKAPSEANDTPRKNLSFVVSMAQKRTTSMLYCRY